jgi:hypothetical protein
VEAILLAVGGIALLGVVVIVIAAGPARGRDVPGLSGLARRFERALPDEDVSPAYGVLSSPTRARRAQRWFERAEQRVGALLRRLARRP